MRVSRHALGGLWTCCIAMAHTNTSVTRSGACREKRKPARRTGGQGGGRAGAVDRVYREPLMRTAFAKGGEPRGACRGQQTLDGSPGSRSRGAILPTPGRRALHGLLAREGPSLVSSSGRDTARTSRLERPRGPTMGFQIPAGRTRGSHQMNPDEFR